MARNFQIQKIRRKKLDRRNDKQNTEQIDQVVLQSIEEYAGHPLAKEQVAEVFKADKFHGADSAPFKKAVEDRACNRNDHKQRIQKQSGRDKTDISTVLPRAQTCGGSFHSLVPPFLPGRSAASARERIYDEGADAPSKQCLPAIIC